MEWHLILEYLEHWRQLVSSVLDPNSIPYEIYQPNLKQLPNDLVHVCA